MEFHPAGHEVVVRDQLANRVIFLSGGMIGRLIITDCRVLHRCIWPLSTVFPNIAVELADVETVSRFNILGVVPNGVAIRTRSGGTINFQVFSAPDIVGVISNLLQQFDRANS